MHDDDTQADLQTMHYNVSCHFSKQYLLGCIQFVMSYVISTSTLHDFSCCPVVCFVLHFMFWNLQFQRKKMCCNYCSFRGDLKCQLSFSQWSIFLDIVICVVVCNIRLQILSFFIVILNMGMLLKFSDRNLEVSYFVICSRGKFLGFENRHSTGLIKHSKIA